MLRRLGKQCLQQFAHCRARSALPSNLHLSAVAAAAAVNLPVCGRNSALCWPTSPLIQRLGGIAAFGSCASSFAAHSGYTALNTLSDNPGAVRKGRRVGRGIGSSKGKTAGRGHKGQKSRAGRSPRLGFEGGQTPMRFRVPKKGAYNPFTLHWELIELGRIEQWVQQGRLDPGQVITMRHLRDSGAVFKRVHNSNGVKLMGTGGRQLHTALHLQVSQATAQARAAVEACGGSVTTVYYNKLGFKALMDPQWFKKKGRLLPNPARPPPKMEARFDVIGSLPPDLSFPAASSQETILPVRKTLDTTPHSTGSAQ